MYVCICIGVQAITTSCKSTQTSLTMAEIEQLQKRIDDDDEQPTEELTSETDDDPDYDEDEDAIYQIQRTAGMTQS